MKLIQKLVIAVALLTGSASFAADVADLLLPDAQSYDAAHSLAWGPGPMRPPGRYPPGRPMPPPRRPNPPPPYRPAPPPPRYGNMICTATDTGWEEHWGGHASCHECLRAHNNCNETCEATYDDYSCTSIGYGHDGRQYSFIGRGRTDWDARNDARNQCYNYGMASCQDNGCQVTRNREVVSRRSCR